MIGNYLEFNVFFDIIGTIAFAISGAILGCKKKMDILGVIVLGLVTALGEASFVTWYLASIHQICFKIQLTLLYPLSFQF